MSAEFGSDPWLDARLRDVPLPPGVLARLEQIAATPDDELDGMVREVPVPPDLIPRLSRIPRVPRRRLPLRELSLAAAVLIAVGVGLLNMRVQPVQQPTGDGAKFVGRALAGQRVQPSPRRAMPSWQAIQLLRGVPSSCRSTIRASRKIGTCVTSPPRRPNRWRPNPRRPIIRHRPTAKASPASRKSTSPSVVREHGGILTAPRGSDRLPPLETVNRTLNRGLAPALVPGYDLLYQLKTGERPFVSPESDPALVSSTVPLTRDTSSYVLARESIAGGHLPPADEVRIEDFLAAIGDLFPASGAPVALHVNAGAAPFGEPGMQLLQVGLRAGGPLTPDPATGLPRVVARGATLTVTFKPQVVQAYRLVGHATTTLTGPVAAVTKVDLTAGAEMAGLFELWLKPTGGDDVATVELVWHDPVGGARRHLTGRVSRPQFAATFVESAASLQAVALAAETARALRLHAAPGRGLGRVLDLAAQVQPQLQKSESFGQLMHLVAQADKVRANPGAGARRAAADSQP